MNLYQSFTNSTNGIRGSFACLGSVLWDILQMLHTHHIGIKGLFANYSQTPLMVLARLGISLHVLNVYIGNLLQTLHTHTLTNNLQTHIIWYQGLFENSRHVLG